MTETMENIRPHSDFMDHNLGKIYPVLDHGFIILRDYMGNESSVVNAARISYQKGTRKVNDDINLLRYLIRHFHNTPLEMCEIAIHVKLPIFVARQWIRHRTSNVNEQSARYSILDKEFYIPEPQHIQPQSTTNNQGRAGSLNVEQIYNVQRLLISESERSYERYSSLLGEHNTNDYLALHTDDSPGSDYGRMLAKDQNFPGIARELARMNLSLNFYTQWIWKTDLSNLMNFLQLRSDSHAQYEIRVYADIILELVKGWTPNIYQAFLDFKKNAYNLSGPQIAVLKTLLSASNFTAEEKTKILSALPKRERADFVAVLGIGDVK